MLRLRENGLSSPFECGKDTGRKTRAPFPFELGGDLREDSRLSSSLPIVNRLRDAWRRHPLLRDAVLWSVPALIVGAILRLLILSYSPYAYWGSDSQSFFEFTNNVLTKFTFGINQKRQYLYPIFLLPITMLPGGTLRNLAWIQALIGLLTVLPFAYIIRRAFVGWKWIVIPLTLLFVGLPVFLWYEHELIGDSMMFFGLIWAMGGWAAWTSQSNPARARFLWWTFLVPFAVIVLSKPSVKFFWPGIFLALVVVLAWRTLRWKEWTALALLFAAGLTVGSDKQSAWLLYTTAFPFTQIDSPLHAEYKAEIRELVLEKRARLDFYDEEDDQVHDFLRDGGKGLDAPKWQALSKNRDSLNAMYKDLAFEAIRARPDLFLYVALRRMIGSANPDEFKGYRFAANYFAERYAEQLRENKNPESMIRLTVAIPRGEPIPSVEAFTKMLAPDPDSPVAKWMMDYTLAYNRAGAILGSPSGHGHPLSAFLPTVLGWFVIAGGLISLVPPYLRSLGIWNIAMAGYLFAVYLVGVENHRYFAPAFPLMMLCLGTFADAAFRVGLRVMVKAAPDR